jgi:hypothetical protein
LASTEALNATSRVCSAMRVIPAATSATCCSDCAAWVTSVATRSTAERARAACPRLSFIDRLIARLASTIRSTSAATCA